ncbi:hypothetical protein POV13_21530, partial [Enterobacter roggenkampii]
IGPDPRNFNQRVSLGRHDLLIRTFPKPMKRKEAIKQRVNLDKKGVSRVEHCVHARSLRFYL